MYDEMSVCPMGGGVYILLASSTQRPELEAACTTKNYLAPKPTVPRLTPSSTLFDSVPFTLVGGPVNTAAAKHSLTESPPEEKLLKVYVCVVYIWDSTRQLCAGTLNL